MALTDDDSEVISLAVLVGFSIVDAQTGAVVGSIADIDDSTANILFELSDGRLIPAADEFISQIDKDKRQISMRLPEGLLEL